MARDFEDFHAEILRSLEADGDICKRLSIEKETGMQMKHWAVLVMVLVVGYYLGTKYPNLLSSVTAAA